MPYYVVGKDMAKNQVFVTTDINDGVLWQSEISLTSLHWIDPKFQPPSPDHLFQVRTRHRAPLIECTVEQVGERLQVKLKDEIRALTPGQSAVLYDGQVCLGGGIIV